MNFEEDDTRPDDTRRDAVGQGDEESQDPQARVAEIDRRLAELRATLENRADGPGDQVDAASSLSLRDEILMMMETLENEKNRLLGRSSWGE